jgi:hypothetical protein
VSISSIDNVVISTCRNCEFSIPKNAPFCSSCGAPNSEACTSERTLANANGQALRDHRPAKSSSVDNLLLSLAVLLFVGLCFTIVGIVPVLIMILGAVLAFKSGDARNVRVTGRFAQFFVLVGIFICLGFLAVNSSSSYVMNYQLLPIASLGLSLGLIALLIEFLWIRPFTRQLPGWRAARSHKKLNAKNTRIIGRDSHTPYSIADELLKWSKLREDGLITENEYQQARMNLLNRR